MDRETEDGGDMVFTICWYIFVYDRKCVNKKKTRLQKNESLLLISVYNTNINSSVNVYKRFTDLIQYLSNKRAPTQIVLVMLSLLNTNKQEGHACSKAITLVQGRQTDEA